MKLKFLSSFTALVAAFIFILNAGAIAQVTTGDISGRVSDQSGAAVPNITVTATNKATGQTRSAQTNGEGDYLIPRLVPGRYDVTAEGQNFSKALVKDLEVNVGTKQTINIELKPGQISETVEITADAAGLETTRSELGKTITPTEIQNLPIINRTFANLSIVAPEARPTGTFDPTKTRVGTVAFSGGDGRQVDVNVDGGDNKDNVVGSLLQNFAYESIQEFQVLQHRWTAESGRSVGGVVNVISKSGTNMLHGSAFFNMRNESLRARDFFEKQSSSDKSQYQRQEYGGSLGGPIIKDKFFFFGAYERFRERQDLLVNPALIPQINAIPGVTASDTIPTPYNDHLLTLKFDGNLNSKQSISGRFSYQKNNSPNDQFDPTLPSDLTGGNTNDNRLYSTVVSHNYTIDSTKLNQFLFQFQDFKNEILSVTDNPNVTFPSVQTGANVNVPQQTLERKYQFRDDFSWQKGDHAMKFGMNYIHTQLGGFFFFGANGYQIFFFDDPLTIRNNLPSANCPTPNTSCYPQGFSTPGAVATIQFSGGVSDNTQGPIHQLAFYFQDDWKVTRKLTLNLGLRWDANIGLLVDQTTNRTMQILDQLNEPRANALTDDKALLARTTSSYKEFQPRFGFAYDPKGDGNMVIRGGYGIFYDQVFQNLTLFSLTQSTSEIYQTVLDLNNSAVGVGQLPNFVYGTTPLPSPGAANNTQLGFGAFGRINDPTMEDPYVQKFSIGFEKRFGSGYLLSSDYVHTLGLHETRVLNINPQIDNICDSRFPGANPADPRCVRGANSRYFDQAFVAAGLGAGRLEQINMFSTNNRSRFDSWATTLRKRTNKMLFSLSYVLSSSKAWGGLPTASYSGNGVAVTPENQFKPEEFGPTRIDERHRIVASGVFDLPYGIQLAPIFQFASARPYAPIAGVDLDGDGRSTLDRICSGTTPQPVGTPASGFVRGCTQSTANSLRNGFVPNGSGGFNEVSGRYINLDLRATKSFSIGERVKVKGYVNFFNLLNRENLSFADRLGTSNAASGLFMQPVSLYGPGFGPPVGLPFTVQLGARVDF
jgi:hypothetical protein